MGVTTEPPHVHKSSGIAPRNGTSTHVINFTTDGDAPFTPANGNLLLLIIFGGVTNANAGGWNEQLSPVSSGELSLFTFTASSTTSITITHNASNYPCPWTVIELPAGSTYTSGQSDNASSETFPTLGSLPGTEQLIYGARGRIAGGSETNATAVWTAPWVEDSDQFITASGTDGAHLTVGHQINVTATSITPAPATTYSGTWGVGDREKIVFAINAVAPSSTTPFTKDYSLQWNVLNTFAKDYTVNWRVLNALQKDYTLNWRVLNSLTKDYSLLWRVLNTIAKDYTVNWRVLNSLTKDYTLNWRVLNSFTKDYALQWDVLSGTSFVKDYTISWNVLNTFQKDYQLQWNVLNSFTKDYQVLWRVLNSIQKDYTLNWRVLNTIQKDYQFLWDVLAATGFTKDYQILWNVRNTFAKDYDLRWRVLSIGALEFYLWRNGIETPLTVEGVWNGTAVVPYDTLEVI
jgi:hypothetical protein